MKGSEARWDPKGEAIRLWEADPCGGAVGTSAEATPEFFAAVDKDRYEHYAPWMRDAMGFHQFSGMRVLEVGSGMGTDLAQLCRGGAVAVGIDLVPRHLRIAAARLFHEGFPIRLVRSDAEQLPFKDCSVDVVYSFGVLHHTPNIEAAIEEIRRVLKAEGLTIIGLYHRDSVFFWFYTILLRGVLRGVLFRKGYRRLVADIERHDHSDALPLVRVYSRRQVKRLLASFRSVSIETYHLQADHLYFLPRGIRRVLGPLVERYGRRWGWYVIAKARK